MKLRTLIVRLSQGRSFLCKLIEFSFSSSNTFVEWIDSTKEGFDVFLSLPYNMRSFVEISTLFAVGIVSLPNTVLGKVMSSYHI